MLLLKVRNMREDKIFPKRSKQNEDISGEWLRNKRLLFSGCVCLMDADCEQHNCCHASTIILNMVIISGEGGSHGKKNFAVCE